MFWFVVVLAKLIDLQLTRHEEVWLGLLAILAAERCWYLGRMLYLNRRAKLVKLDLTKETTLRYAIWSHVGILAVLCAAVLMLFPSVEKWGGVKVAPLFYLPIPLFMLVMMIIFSVVRLRARVVIGLGRQLCYFNGYDKHEVIYSGQIVRYTCNGYSYFIWKNDGGRLKIPATWSRGEVVRAFLEDAIQHSKSAHH